MLAGLGVARWKAWPAVEQCLLKFLIITLFPILSAVGILEEVLLFSVDFSVSKPIVISPTGSKFLFENASLSFPN